MEPSIHMQERRDRRGRRAPALAAMAVIVVLGSALFGLFGFLETNAAFGTILDLEDKYICDSEALVLDFPDLSRLSEVYSADGVLLGKLNERNSQPVAFEDIPDTVKWALLSAEDGGFYDHEGVDFKAIARAALDNVRSGNLIGGSTITQQIVKQNFLTDERTIERKICEAVVAAELERQYTKDQILEFYMNAQFFGENAYGVQAAAQEYWGAELDDVTVAQAAAMVVPIRNPSFYDLRDNPVGVLARRNDVIDQMAENGFITVAEAEDAKLEPMGTIEPQPFDEPAPQVLIDARLRLLRDNTNQFGLGATFDERRKAIFGCPANDAGCEGGGGLKVFVTVDFAMQEEANRILRDWFRYEDSPTGAIAMVDNATGAIKVVASGIEFGEDIEAGQRPYDLATEGARQAGSSFKPFGLLTALEQGTLDGRQITLSSYWDATSPQEIDCGEFPCDTDDTPDVWEVRGGIREGGIMQLEDATFRSINAVYAQVAKQVGPENIVEVAHRMGIESELRPVLSITLGTNEVSPLEMAAAYSTIANFGTKRDTYLIERIEDEAGNVIYQHTVEESQVLDEALVAAAVGAMEKVVARGTARRRSASEPGADIGRPQAGKTGTTDDAADLWFVGFIPQYTTSVWVGYPDSRTELQGFTVYYPPTESDKEYKTRIFGGTLAAPIWKEFMEYVTADLPVLDFPDDPPGTDAYRQIPFTVVPDLAVVARELEADALTKRQISTAYWKAGLNIEFEVLPSVRPEGTILGQNPIGGTRLRQGTTAIVQLSSGIAPEVPDWRGLNRFDIESTILALNAATGLDVTWVTQDVPTNEVNLWNTVVGTNPGIGTLLNPGDEITFFVAVPPPIVPPDP
jgi:penicillin-binding protein 1A